ncbi:MAG: hypothetical protein R2818_15420 [Flavobacteriales bacterium]
MEAIPLGPRQKPYHTVVLTVDKAKTEPMEIQVLYKDGNIVTYALLVASTTEPVTMRSSASTRRYPGVEVNDMR